MLRRSRRNIKTLDDYFFFIEEIKTISTKRDAKLNDFSIFNMNSTSETFSCFSCKDLVLNCFALTLLSTSPDVKTSWLIENKYNLFQIEGPKFVCHPCFRRIFYDELEAKKVRFNFSVKDEWIKTFS